MGNHRAQRRAPRPAGIVTPRAPGGRRRATPAPKHPLTGLPMVPTVAGAVAVAVAAGGAATAGAGKADAVQQVQSDPASMQAPAFSEFDTLGMGADLDQRQQAISRDSERDALQDAADTRLQSAVESQARQRNAALTNLARSAETQAAKIKKNAWHLPTTGYHLTARFGNSGGLWSHNHTGLDFATATGTPITAVANGVITETGYDGSYGNKTVERLEDGTEIWYAHQSEIDVKPGDRVIGGQQIGHVGSTGNVTGPHVHVEVRPGGGDPVDPYTAMIYHGLQP
ncbi:hypothetical protein GCM10011519_32130 [Marmoricola endophyticus]|uniref:M23ase beta-sheet core domain-containing protein n=1 Tax=Marmoricola endophyticus TaxID=2040280 RepID=A0A917BR90_9ACTN|nr:M23 family metallopeptidase [Marmoricola endophyticus]GGF55787.1 hypothetical protein GCM10011519_32130 [Marmoricola endophyticus]